MPSSTQSSRIPSLRGLVLLSALLVSALGCATQGRPAPGPDYAKMEAVYNATVVNSAVYRAKHQVNSLWPVSMDETTPMVSFISCDNCPDGGGSGGGCSSKCSLTCSSYPPNPCPEQAPSDIWVSRADQVLAYCQSLPQDLTAAEVILKIQQLQGLPPQVNSDPCTWQILQLNVVGLQVPEEFFRPCTNPDPTTTGPCTAMFGDPAPDIGFQAWMAGQAFSSWQIPSGYPWTHLGYTYNWDPKAKSIIGTSEYVIRKHTNVQVTGLVPAVPYCTQNRLTCPQ